MSVADEDNPMFNGAYHKKLREEKKNPLRPMSAKEIREAFGRRKDRIGINVSPYVKVSDLNHSSEEPSVKPISVIEVGIKINF